MKQLVRYTVCGAGVIVIATIAVIPLASTWFLLCQWKLWISIPAATILLSVGYFGAEKLMYSAYYREKLVEIIRLTVRLIIHLRSKALQKQKARPGMLVAAVQ